MKKGDILYMMCFPWRGDNTYKAVQVEKVGRKYLYVYGLKVYADTLQEVSFSPVRLFRTMHDAEQFLTQKFAVPLLRDKGVDLKYSLPYDKLQKLCDILECSAELNLKINEVLDKFQKSLLELEQHTDEVSL